VPSPTAETLDIVNDMRCFVREEPEDVPFFPVDEIRKVSLDVKPAQGQHLLRK
jgi:hypothetical protein